MAWPCSAGRRPSGRRSRRTAAGVGQLIDAAIAAGGRIVVGLGGSGCTDGGRALVDALGGLPAARARLAGVELIAATDVEHPLLGPMGAAAVFGPQKGADPATVVLLEARLAEWAAELNAVAGRDVGAEPGAGAAGGIGAALLALGGRSESGAAVIAEHTGLAADVAAAELIITGEGRFDDQSLHGKVVSALAAGARDTPVLVLAGQVTLDARRAAGRGHHRRPLDRGLRRLDSAGDRRCGEPVDRTGAANGRRLAGRVAESGIAGEQGTVEVSEA